MPRSAHAQFTGIVCLSAITTSCPSSAPTFGGSVGNQIVVNVVIQGSDSLNGFDISVQADPQVLSPVSISSAGNVFAGQITFTQMNSTNTSTGVARLVQVVLGFMTPDTPIAYPSGCSNSSVAGTTTCVQVVNAGTVDPETVQGATFTTAAGFILTASSSSLSLKRGSSGSVTILVTGTGGFTGSVSLLAVVSPVIKHGPSATLNPTSVTLSASNTVGTSSLTVSALHSTPIRAYTVTVTGSSGTISHSVTIQVTVS